MKRPQGYDRSAASAQPPVQPPPPPQRSARSASPKRGTAITEPIPIVSALPAGAPPAATPEPSTPSPTPYRTPQSAGPSKPAAAGYDALPSNREIGRELRRAKKERARVERGEVRRFTKRSRRRKLAWFGALGVVAALVLGVSLTAFSPLMALRTIDVTGTSRLDVAAVKKALDDQLGRPLPLVDQGAIRGDLAAFPLIRSYSVESHPPNTIVVRIVERQPIGVLQSGSTFTLVDAAKVSIETADKRQDGYPLITASGAAAETDAKSGFAAAAEVLGALPHDLLARVDTISATTADDVNFTLRDSGAKVVWGSADDSGLKVADLSALLKSAADASVFDVSSPHSVTTG